MLNKTFWEDHHFKKFQEILNTQNIGSEKTITLLKAFSSLHQYTVKTLHQHTAKDNFIGRISFSFHIKHLETHHILDVLLSLKQRQGNFS